VYLRESLTFRSFIPPPSSASKSKKSKKPAEAGGKLSILVSYFAYSSTLNVEMIYYSET
jgi:hypothetical protein